MRSSSLPPRAFRAVCGGFHHAQRFPHWRGRAGEDTGELQPASDMIISEPVAPAPPGTVPPHFRFSLYTSERLYIFMILYDSFLYLQYHVRHSSSCGSCYIPDVDLGSYIDANVSTWLVLIMHQLLCPPLSSLISVFFSFTFLGILFTVAVCCYTLLSHSLVVFC